MSETNLIPSTETLTSLTTEELKEKLITLTKPRDQDSLSQKNKFYQTTLSPLFEELATRNLVRNPQEQSNLVIGVWKPIWSTIPFQDILPGRQREQSYQIFRKDGYYANIARYTPGTNLPLLRHFNVYPLAYDLMLIQKYETTLEEWLIENVSIKQALKLGGSKLTLDKAQNWFEKEMNTPLEQVNSGKTKVKLPFLKKANQKASKQLQGAAQAKPKLEHLYLDQDFRLVKSQRENKQRPSYTITVRADGVKPEI
ncbi:MAG: hypothetical protein ACLFQP_06795 [Halothece sp.]